VQGGDQASGVRLAELVAAFSLATDLGLGQPMEHVLRSWLIAVRLGERWGLAAEERESLFFVMLLAWVGCVADTTEVSAWFGDDIRFRGDSYQVDLAGLPMIGFFLGHAGRGGSFGHRIQLATNLVVTRGRAVEQGLRAHCVSTGQLAARLGLSAGVCEALQQVFTRWDARGVPSGFGGSQIAHAVRLFHLADTVEAHHRYGGVPAALEVARARRGTHFDPQLVDLFCDVAGDLLVDLDSRAELAALIDGEPRLCRAMSQAELESALEVLADFTDLRSRYRAGHSRAVAELATRAAALSGLRDGEIVMLRRAALTHDIGLHGVPGSILDKPGPLSSAEAERIRLRSYWTERVLARPAALAAIGELASMANERLDGSGYHRGLSGAAIPATGRILAAADAYRAMSEPRPHRPALSGMKIAAGLRRDVRAGRLDGQAVEAVLQAAGRRPRGRRSGPQGLTARELEVLVLIARGASTRQVARMLGISAKTVGTHVEHIYTKTGASTRTTATLFAVQHGLLDSLDPVDR